MATLPCLALLGTPGLPTRPAAAAQAPLLFGLGDPTDQARRATERLLDKRSAIVGSFANRTLSPTFWGSWARQVRAGGGVVQLAWDPTWGRKGDPHSTLRSVLAGEHDAYIRRWAGQVRAYGHPVLVRLWAEMNGRWQPYAAGMNGNRASEFAPAWRHVVTVARSVGADNILWVWNPDKPYRGLTPLRYLWPGGAYVDWVGLDSYHWGTGHWHPFPEQVSVPLRRLKKLTGDKPLMINEIGCNTSTMGSKGGWIAGMYDTARRFDVRAIVYFDYARDGADWRFASPPSTIPPIRAAVHRPGIVGAGDLGVAAIEDLLVARRVRGAVPGDLVGRGATSIATWNAAGGLWSTPHHRPVRFGSRGDVPVPADYTGGGVADLAVWRPGRTSATWYVRGRSPVRFGARGDVPVPADYDGDGRAELAVWRPATGTWRIRGQGDTTWGRRGDVPVPGDYDGDGRAELAVYRPSTGSWEVRGQPPRRWGEPGDVPLPGDYTGDGRTDPALFRPGTGDWFFPGGRLRLGDASTIPVPGDYASAGRVRPAVLDPAAMSWRTGAGPATAFGTAGDVPVMLPEAVRQRYFGLP